MLDLLLGIFFAFLLVRGWTRGFVKEAMDLVGMLVGLAVAFRLSSAAGSVVGGILGSSPAISRVIGGLALFAIVGGGAAVLAHYLHKVARLPGLALSNRLTGAGLAVAWGAFLATLGCSPSAATHSGFQRWAKHTFAVFMLAAAGVLRSFLVTSPEWAAQTARQPWRCPQYAARWRNWCKLI